MATRRAATKTVATTENTTKETAPVKTTKKFEQNELIECRSLVQGTLFMPGKQSDILYRWDGYGDVREVEYRDLYLMCKGDVSTKARNYSPASLCLI